MIVLLSLAVVVAGVLVWVMLFMAPKNAGDRAKIPELKWDPSDIPGSLERVLDNVQAAAGSASDWYWTHKKPRARASRFIRASAVFLGALAGVVPVALELIRSYSNTLPHAAGEPLTLPWWASGLWASILLGIAAFLVSLDTAFGLSAGWARYVLAATEITRRLAEFKMDWIALTAAAGATPTAEQIAALLQRARDFRLGVEGVVVQETKDWVSAFQSSLAQLEKDLNEQMKALVAQSQARLKESETANQPGSLEVTIPNAEKADKSTVLVSLRSVDGPVVTDEKLLNNKTWIRFNLRPGPYGLTLAADMPTATGSVRRESSVSVLIKAGEQTKASLALRE